MIVTKLFLNFQTHHKTQSLQAGQGLKNNKHVKHRILL